MGTVLLVDDDPAALSTLRKALEGHGHCGVAASSAPEALARADEVDVVLANFGASTKGGLDFLRDLRERDPALPVILLTSHGSERLAVQAVKDGAYDYVRNPFDHEEMLLAVERAVETRLLRARTRQHAIEESTGVRIVGTSSALLRTVELAERIAAKDSTVLLRGEAGTGKELFATLLHARSRRAGKPMIHFTCAAVPPDLAEAQLLGYAKGADALQGGSLSQARGGTLVLDEVGDLPLELQAKLLRVLQDELVDVRFIASTSRDLAAEVRAGRFLEDLYYRLAVVELFVPPLRDRMEDVPLLVREFAKKYSERFGLAHVVQFAPELLASFARSSWPGNVRQLESVVARCVALATGPVVGPRAFVMEDGAAAEPPASSPAISLKKRVEAFERGILTSALAAAGGNQSEVSRKLGLTRASLYDRMKKYGLSSARRD